MYLEKAVELMAKYRISADELDDKNPDAIVERIVPHSDIWGDKPFASIRNGSLRDISKLYGVEVRGNPSIRPVAVLVGREEAIDMALDLFRFLDLQADRFVTDAFPPGPGRVKDPRPVDNVFYDQLVGAAKNRAEALLGFFFGASQKISAALERMTDDEETAGIGLVLLSDYEKALATLRPPLFVTEVGPAEATAPLVAGRRAGKDADINQNRLAPGQGLPALPEGQ